MSDATGHPADSVRLDATVVGRVQGVGFRWFVLDVAQRLDLRGWVANEADGSVRCVAEGPRAVLDALLRELADGPLGARVERVVPRWSPSGSNLGPFEIRSGAHPGD
ncbi:MAG: acylphosphatase [Chloroflexota bacterium]